MKWNSPKALVSYEKIVPSFATFSPGPPNNVPFTLLPVFGPPRVGPLGVWSPSTSRLISYKSQGIHYRKSIRVQHLQKSVKSLLVEGVHLDHLLTLDFLASTGVQSRSQPYP